MVVWVCCLSVMGLAETSGSSEGIKDSILGFSASGVR